MKTFLSNIGNKIKEKSNHGNIRLPDFSEIEGMNYRYQMEYADKMIIKKARF